VLGKLIEILRKPIDCILAIVIILPALIMWFFRRIGAKRLPLTSSVLKSMGVWVIRDHYYEPLFNTKGLHHAASQPRFLPGVDLRDKHQLAFLKKLKFAEEFIDIVNAEERSDDIDCFKIDNQSFARGDSDFLYQFIRYIQPNRIVEIGSGDSTKIAQHAIRMNKINGGVASQHTCFEPYEQPWLEKYSGIQLLRERVELHDTSWIETLEAGDLLFIDSSHMIRPQGDVLFEYLAIIPQLQSGVYVHVHDIFTPRDYLSSWIEEDVRFWNEQYLLEVLLSNSMRYTIVASLNHLKHSYYDELKAVCPHLPINGEPGSLYFKVN
jgi:hypothetical protein